MSNMFTENLKLQVTWNYFLDKNSKYFHDGEWHNMWGVRPRGDRSLQSKNLFFRATEQSARELVGKLNVRRFTSEEIRNGVKI